MIFFITQGLSGGNLLSIPNIVIHSASVCDVDIRQVRNFTIIIFKYPVLAPEK